MNLKKILFFSKNDGETLNEKLDLILDKQTQIEEGKVTIQKQEKTLQTAKTQANT